MERNHPCNSYYPFCKLCPKETFREAMKNNIWNDSNIGKTFEEMNMNIHDSDDWEYIDYLEFYSRKEFMKVRENVKYRLRVKCPNCVVFDDECIDCEFHEMRQYQKHLLKRAKDQKFRHMGFAKYNEVINQVMILAYKAYINNRIKGSKYLAATIYDLIAKLHNSPNLRPRQAYPIEEEEVVNV